jgi:hypothetical protein
MKQRAKKKGKQGSSPPPVPDLTGLKVKIKGVGVVTPPQSTPQKGED